MGLTMLVPPAKEAQIIALCAALFDGGTETVPLSLQGDIFTLCNITHPFF